MKKLLCIIISLFFVFALTGCASDDYKMAVEAYNKKDYETAAQLFEKLDGYKDSRNYFWESKYNIATDLIENKKYDEAYAVLESISDYEPANTLLEKHKVEQAENFMKEANYKEALLLLNEIKTIDTSTLLQAANYGRGCELFNEKQFYEAFNCFVSADGYENAIEYRNESVFYEGVAHVNNAEYANALSCFKGFGGEYNASCSEEYITKIYWELLTGGWRGTYYNDAGVKFNVTLLFQNFDCEYPHTDFTYEVRVSNNNKYMGGDTVDLKLSPEGGRFYDGKYYDVTFSFTGNDKMTILGLDLFSGSFQRFYTKDYGSFKIDESYPTLEIPEYKG